MYKVLELIYLFRKYTAIHTAVCYFSFSFHSRETLNTIEFLFCWVIQVKHKTDCVFGLS